VDFFRAFALVFILCLRIYPLEAASLSRRFSKAGNAFFQSMAS
jgi:hypothetical protein